MNVSESPELWQAGCGFGLASTYKAIQKEIDNCEDDTEFDALQLKESQIEAEIIGRQAHSVLQARLKATAIVNLYMGKTIPPEIAKRFILEVACMEGK